MSIQTEFLKPGNPELGIHPPPAQGVDNLPQVTLYLAIQHNVAVAPTYCQVCGRADLYALRLVPISLLRNGSIRHRPTGM